MRLGNTAFSGSFRSNTLTCCLWILCHILFSHGCGPSPKYPRTPIQGIRLIISIWVRLLINVSDDEGYPSPVASYHSPPKRKAPLTCGSTRLNSKEDKPIVALLIRLVNKSINALWASLQPFTSIIQFNHTKKIAVKALAKFPCPHKFAKYPWLCSTGFFP